MKQSRAIIAENRADKNEAEIKTFLGGPLGYQTLLGKNIARP
jgi:hypothetical protein